MKYSCSTLICGMLFALAVGMIAFIIMNMYVQINIALIVSAVVTMLCVPAGLHLMKGETLRENLLDD